MMMKLGDELGAADTHATSSAVHTAKSVILGRCMLDRDAGCMAVHVDRNRLRHSKHVNVSVRA